MSHRLSRRHSTSFEDQLLELVDDLDDDQVYELLQDLNNTVESNVAVSHGIDLFEHAKHKPIAPPAAPARQTSIRRSAFGLPKLFRSASKRISSAQAPNPRLKTGAPTARRHYRKISRPTLSSYGSVPDLNGALLSAYLARNPAAQCDHNTAPPILETPSPEAAIARLDVQDPGMDILAPFVFGGTSREGEKIGSISEVLGF